MLASVLAFFQALPQLIQLVTRVGAWVKRQETQKWLADLEHTMEKVEGAKTVEEKQNAARDLVRIIRTSR